MRASRSAAFLISKFDFVWFFSPHADCFLDLVCLLFKLEESLSSVSDISLDVLASFSYKNMAGLFWNDMF